MTSRAGRAIHITPINSAHVADLISETAGVAEATLYLARAHLYVLLASQVSATYGLALIIRAPREPDSPRLSVGSWLPLPPKDAPKPAATGTVIWCGKLPHPAWDSEKRPRLGIGWYRPDDIRPLMQPGLTVEFWDRWIVASTRPHSRPRR